ncbi:MAG: IS66 family insertion sequence element accessory protein TnpB [Eubacterium sp.]|mgnify:FL=1|nr:IS66 family insertion sequence element accessory protein TnpB [Eubacterium sp.]
MSDLKHDVIAQRWAALIQERLDSGMTIKEWCLERNIKESQYYYWLKTLRKEELAAADQERQVSPFLALPDICRGWEPVLGKPVAVIRKGAITIEVTESASAGFIARVMEALAHA